MTDEQRLQLEKGFRIGHSHAYRMRCRAILLKSQGLKSKEVGMQTEMTHISVNACCAKQKDIRTAVKEIEE